MPVVSEAVGFLRLAAGLRSFLKSTITPDAARAMVREWIEERETRFLRKIERAVFKYRRSPYLRLFRYAGCEYGDVAGMVRQRGVEGTLEALSECGVHVTWDQLKGRVPVVRGSQTFHFKEADFDNPLITVHYRATSGGTMGVPVRLHVDLDHHAQSAPNWAVLFAAHGWMERPLVFWTPTHTGFANRYLRCAKFGKLYTKWFATTTMTALQDRLRSALVHGLARLMAGLSKPELAPIDRPQRVCDYLVGMLQQGLRPVVNTSPSAAARLSIEMQKRRQTLSGVAFLLGGEPVTPVRRRTIEQCGADAVATYGTSECGWIGAQFPGAKIADEVHVFRDAYAVIHRRNEQNSEGGARPVLFTSLRPAGPKILLNAEIGDSAVLETDADSWPASELGYNVRMHTIRSFRKITPWGVTFAQADLYNVLEEVLPKRFGGGVGDYQLVEQQDSRGLSCLVLRVRPALGEIQEEELRAAFLSEVGRLKSHYGLMTKILSQADALTVERCEPIATARGKVLPVVTNL